MNLKQETLEILKDHHKSASSVLFVTNGDRSCSFAAFLKRAENFEYDPGFGTAEVDLDLKVVGCNWWLERHEYDGSEWWEFKTLPAKAKSGSVKIGRN